MDKGAGRVQLTIGPDDYEAARSQLADATATANAEAENVILIRNLVNLTPIITDDLAAERSQGDPVAFAEAAYHALANFDAQMDVVADVCGYIGAEIFADDLATPQP